MEQNELIRIIAEGFRKTSENSMLKFSLIAGLFVLLIFASALFNRSLKVRRYRLWQKEYDDALRKLDITINEIDLLDELTPFLIDPHRKILILTNRNTLASALKLWETATGKSSAYSKQLFNKLFPGELPSEEPAKPLPFGPGCPVRFVSEKGRSFSGLLEKKDGSSLVIKQVRSMDALEKTGLGHVHIQDYRGIRSYRVRDARKTGPESLTLSIEKLSPPAGRDKFSISEVYLYVYGTEEPVKTRLIKMGRGFGIVINPDGILKRGQLLQATFFGEGNHWYRINAAVTGVSGGGQFARLKFGYLKRYHSD